MPTTVVNRKRTHVYDVYIGRPSIYGNPFRLGTDRDRAAVLAKFRTWFYAPEQTGLRAIVRQTLTGKILGCWCAPQACHGHVYAEYCDTETWNTCPDCGVKWKSLSSTPNVVHRTRLCATCFRALTGGPRDAEDDGETL